MRRGTLPLWGEDEFLEAYSALSDDEKSKVHSYIRRLSRQSHKPRFRWSRLSESWPNVWEAVADMDGYEFEDFIYELCREKQLDVAPSRRRTHDGGVDLFVVGPRPTIVQCKKRRTEKVPAEDVTRLFAACVDREVCHGMLFTNHEFAPAARDARRNLRNVYAEIEIELMDRRRIDEWLRSPQLEGLKEVFRDPRRLANRFRKAGRREEYVQRRLGPLKHR